MYRVPRWVALAVVACSTALLPACGNRYVKEERLPTTGATLEGTVSYGSEKVPVALIIVAGGNGSTTGEIDEATGRYRVENVPTGEVKIGVNTEAARGMMQGKLMSGYYKGPEAKSKGVFAPPKVVDVPPKYAKPETSGIHTTINSGANEYNIQIPK
jgi:hypothetical protein